MNIKDVVKKLDVLARERATNLYGEIPQTVEERIALEISELPLVPRAAENIMRIYDMISRGDGDIDEFVSREGFHYGNSYIAYLLGLTGRINPLAFDIPWYSPNHLLEMSPEDIARCEEEMRSYNDPADEVDEDEARIELTKKIIEVRLPQPGINDMIKVCALSRCSGALDPALRILKEHPELELQDMICCREDILVYLLSKGIARKDAIEIMEWVRKGRGTNGLPEKWVDEMLSHNTEDWFLDVCRHVLYLPYKTIAVRDALRCQFKE